MNTDWFSVHAEPNMTYFPNVLLYTTDKMLAMFVYNVKAICKMGIYWPREILSDKTLNQHMQNS